MFAISLQTSVIAIAQIFTMGALGYFLVKKQVVNENGLKLLSFLSVNVMFPLFIFIQITQNFNPATMPFWWGYPLINISLTVLGLVLIKTIFMIGRQPLKADYAAVCAFHNAGYIPMLLAMSLPLGDWAGKVYPAVILSIIGFDLCLWTIGVWLLTREQKGHMDLRNIINPPLVSMFSALAVVLLLGPKPFPADIIKPVKIMGDSAMALAMLVIGGNLALTKLKNMDIRNISGVVLVKLIAMPLIVLCVILMVPFDPVMKFVLMLQSCMPSAITISIIARHYGTKNQDFINQSIFLTHLLCMLTLPLFLWAFGKWGQ